MSHKTDARKEREQAERANKLDDKTVAARIHGEAVRTLENIASRTERPQQMWWLSFADDDGFRGAVIVHAEDFLTALMECNLRGINPHGECKGRPVPAGAEIAEKWKYRILSRADCAAFDAEMMRAERGG